MYRKELIEAINTTQKNMLSHHQRWNFDHQKMQRLAILPTASTNLFMYTYPYVYVGWKYKNIYGVGKIIDKEHHYLSIVHYYELTVRYRLYFEWRNIY